MFFSSFFLSGAWQSTLAQALLFLLCGCSLKARTHRRSGPALLQRPPSLLSRSTPSTIPPGTTSPLPGVLGVELRARQALCSGVRPSPHAGPGRSPACQVACGKGEAIHPSGFAYTECRNRLRRPRRFCPLSAVRTNRVQLKNKNSKIVSLGGGGLRFPNSPGPPGWHTPFPHPRAPGQMAASGWPRPPFSFFGRAQKLHPTHSTLLSP